MIKKALITIAVLIGGLFGLGEPGLGAISFPSSLDTFTNPTATDRTDVVPHATQHANANDAIEALQAKVGANGSAVTTSHSYKLSGVTGSDIAASLAGSETLTNKTLTSPLLTNAGISTLTSTSSSLIATTTVTLFGNPFTLSGGNVTINTTGYNLALTLGSDATGDVFYRNSSGYVARLAAGGDGEVLKLASGIPSWEADSAGIGVTMRAYLSGDQGLAAGSSTIMQFDSESFDTGSDFNTSTYEYTVPSSGKYLVTIKANVDGFSQGEARMIVNGSIVSLGLIGANDGAQNGTAAFTEIVDLTANDILKFQITTSDISNLVGGSTETVLTIAAL
jgi:hypothetical protein